MVRFEIRFTCQWFVEIILPVEFNAVKTLVVDGLFSLSDNHAGYKGFPLLDFRIVGFFYYFEDSLPEDGDSEICI